MSLPYLSSHLAIVHPAQGGKVCGLCTVEAMVETSMIAIGKGDHKLPFILSYLVREGGNVIRYMSRLSPRNNKCQKTN